MFKSVCVAGLCVFSHVSYAQTAADRTIQQNQNLIQDFERQKRFEEQQKAFEQEQKALGADLDYNEKELPKQGPCIDIETINKQIEDEERGGENDMPDPDDPRFG